MTIVHVELAASVPVHVPPAAPAGLENGDPEANAPRVMPLRATPALLLCSVNVWVTVAPCQTLPKLSVVGVTLADAPFASTNSTAPMSTSALLLGLRAVPKIGRA